MTKDTADAKEEAGAEVAPADSTTPTATAEIATPTPTPTASSTEIATLETKVGQHADSTSTSTTGRSSLTQEMKLRQVGLLRQTSAAAAGDGDDNATLPTSHLIGVVPEPPYNPDDDDDVVDFTWIRRDPSIIESIQPIPVVPLITSLNNNDGEEAEARVGAFSIPGPPGMAMDWNRSIRRDEESISTVEPTLTASSLEQPSLETPLDATLVEEEEARGEGEEEQTPSSDARRSQSRHHRLPELEEATNVKVLRKRKIRTQPSSSSNRGNDSPKYLKGYLAIFVCIAVIVLVLTVSLTLQKANQKEDPTSSSGLWGPTENAITEPTTATTLPQNVLYPPFDDSGSLAPQSIRDIAQADPPSPQYLANQWMWKDPSLSTYPSWRKQQRFALAVKYYALNGPHWFRRDHWLSYNVSECYWYNVLENPTAFQMAHGVCDEEGKVILQNLHHNNLRGVVPLEHHPFFLQKGNHSSNHLQGALPVLMNSGDIQETILSDNEFEGPLMAHPASNYSSLRVLKLNGNRFEGNIQFGLLLFDNMEILNLTSNLFGRGNTIPTELGYNTKLRYLGLGHNEYSGSIPTELQGLSHLQEIDFSGNPGVNGSLPDFLGSLTNLTVLDIAGTSITGTVPDRLCLRMAAADNDNADHTTSFTLVADCDTGLLQCC